jgi:predicted nucleic acid-binding protein
MLVDTSLWIDHLRRGNSRLVPLLEVGEVESHRFVLGELACGDLGRRVELLSLLGALPQVAEAEHDEVLMLINTTRLNGCGLGWVDAHLLASAILSGTTLWTLDKRLAAQAARLGVLFKPASQEPSI